MNKTVFYIPAAQDTVFFHDTDTKPCAARFICAFKSVVQQNRTRFIMSVQRQYAQIVQLTPVIVFKMQGIISCHFSVFKIIRKHRSVLVFELIKKPFLRYRKSCETRSIFLRKAKLVCDCHKALFYDTDTFPDIVSADLFYHRSLLPFYDTLTKNKKRRKLCVFIIWSGLRGSNSLPPPWQGGALPDELNPRGASGRNRTNDTRIFSPLLYRLSYRGL